MSEFLIYTHFYIFQEILVRTIHYFYYQKQNLSKNDKYISTRKTVTELIKPRLCKLFSASAADWERGLLSGWRAVTGLPSPLQKILTDKAGITRSRTHASPASYPVSLLWAFAWTQGPASKVQGTNTISPLPLFLIFPSFEWWPQNLSY